MHFRKRLAVTATALALLVLASAAFPAGGPSGRDHLADGSTGTGLHPAAASGREDAPVRIEGSFIVDLAPGLDPHEAANGIAADHGGEVVHVYDEVVGGFSFRGSDEARDGIAGDPRVRGVSDDYEVYAAQADPPRAELVHIDAPPAWGSGRLGSGVTIAVLDSGVAPSSPHLAGNIAGASTCVGGSPNDVTGHGTAVLGVAVGNHGVWPQGRAYSIKVFPDSSSTAWSNVVCGLNQVAAINAIDPVHAVNLSLSGPRGTSALEEAVDHLHALGIAVVASAGNEGRDVRRSAPASYPNTVAVSAINSATMTMASFSNFGDGIDLTGPGVAISVLRADGTCCSLSNGTSFSAPHVAALMGYGVWAGLSPPEALDALRSSGTCPSGADAPCTGQQWPGDRDNVAETLINVLGTVNGVDGPPTGEFTNPLDGQKVDGTVDIRVLADDDEPLPSEPVAIAIAGGPFQTTTLVGGQYQRTWDTTASPDGIVELQARITDSAGQMTTISIEVEVDNIDDPPQVEWVFPVDGATVNTAFGVHVTATDDRDIPAVQLFVGGISQGPPISPNLGDDGYTWNVVDLDEGPVTLRVDASDGTHVVQSSIDVEVSAALYRQSFDGGPGDPVDLGQWQVTGRTPLWHPSTSECGQPASGAFFYYGLSTSCTYDNGRANNGLLTTPVLTGLPESYSLSLLSRREVELCSCTRDATTIEVNYTGARRGWQTVWSADGRDPSTNAWETLSFDLGSPTGQLQVRFTFTTGSRQSNEHFGWAIDEFTLRQP